MKKFLLSIFSIFMLLTGVYMSGCGEGALVYYITLKSETFKTDADGNVKDDYIEIDIVSNPTVTIKATVENQADARVSVFNNYEDKVKINTTYNANLNESTITLTALEEGTAELIIDSYSGDVQEKKVLVYIYSDITGLSQKSEKKRQYVLQDTNFELLAENYLDVSARETCNRKDVFWGYALDETTGEEINYGGALVISNNILRLDSKVFNNYKVTHPDVVNKIIINAKSKYTSHETDVELDVIEGIKWATNPISGSRDIGSGEVDIFDAEKKPIAVSLVRTSGDTESEMYYTVKFNSPRDVSWVTLTDDVLYEKFGIPTGTLDITQFSKNVDSDNNYTFVFKVVNENSVTTGSYGFNFTFTYNDYDYTFATDMVKIKLIDVVQRIEVTGDDGGLLNEQDVNVYNTYASGKGQYFNVGLYPFSAEDTNYELVLKVAEKLTGEVPKSFSVERYVKFYTEAGGAISFAYIEVASEADSNYDYYKANIKFSNGTRLYAVGVDTTNLISARFVSHAKNTIHTEIPLNLVFAPTENFAITGNEDTKYIETGDLGEYEYKISCDALVGVGSSDLYLDYAKNSAYNVEISAKDTKEITIKVTLLEAGHTGDVDITLFHKNGYKATSSLNVNFFKALTEASVSLLNANSSNIAQYELSSQDFAKDLAGETLPGAKSNETLSKLIASFGTSVSLQFAYDAGDSIDEVKLHYYAFGQSEADRTAQQNIITGAEGDEVPENKYFFEKVMTGLTERPNYFSYNNKLGSLTFLTPESSYTGYVVIEFIGYDENHNVIKLYRIIDVESYVPVSALSTDSTLVETVASDSLSAEDALFLSKKAVEVRFRNERLPAITYYDVVKPEEVEGHEEPCFTIYSATAGKEGASGSYTFDQDTMTMRYNGVEIYTLTDVTSANGIYMTFNVIAHTTNDFSEFVDTIVVEYNSFKSYHRLGIEIKITNSERVSKVVWENETDDNTIYLVLGSKTDIEATIITTVSEAYNTKLRYQYTAASGSSSLVYFKDNGRYKNVCISNGALLGGHGYIYILPEDSIKANNKISYNYYDDSDIKIGLVSVNELGMPSTADASLTWFDYLCNNAFFVDLNGNVVRYSDIMHRIKLIVADGLSEDTALRIYSDVEVKAMTAINHYVLMNNVTIEKLDNSLLSGAEFVGSLRGYNDLITITMFGSAPLFETIGEKGAVKNLKLNGTIKSSTLENVGFVAQINNGTIDNVVIDVYYDGAKYQPSEIALSSANSFAGAIIGENNGTVKNSKALGVSVHDAKIAGGVAGKNNGKLESCAVEIYKFDGQINSIEARENAGGLVGYAVASSSISGSYVYDYTLTSSTTDFNISSSKVGALIGDSELEAKISNSFAVVGLMTYCGDGDVTIEDCYTSYYSAGVYKTSAKETTSALWVQTTDAAYQSWVNGGEKHLKFYQSKPVDLDSVKIKEATDRHIYVADDTAIVYLYEIDSYSSLNNAEETALRRKNTYSLSDLFDGISEEHDDSIVASSGNTDILSVNINSFELLRTGETTIKVISKQDFTKPKTFTIKVIHILTEFKALYNGEETSGADVQEGRSEMIEFTVKDSTYLNTATNYKLVLDKINVKTDGLNETPANASTTFDIENNVGIVTIANGEIEQGNKSFTANAYIQITGLEDNYNTALKSRFEKTLTFTPFEGTNHIGADYSSITIYPAISSTFDVTLTTDSSSDELWITIEHNGVKLNVTKDGVAVANQKITSVGTYVLSYGAQEKRLTVKVGSSGYSDGKIIYQLTIGIYDDYKYSISEAEHYTIKLNAKNDKTGALQKEVDLILESQAIDNIDIANYKIYQVRREGASLVYKRSDQSISLMAPGASSILEVTVDPAFSYYEYLTISYVPTNNALLTLTPLQTSGAMAYKINTSSSISSISYGVKIVPSSKKISSHAFKVYVSSNITEDCILPITVTFYGYNAKGEIVPLDSATINLYITCLAQPSVKVDGEEFAKLAKGSSATVEVLLESDQELESITLEGANPQNIYMSYISLVDNGDGTKTYTYKLLAGVSATVDYNVEKNPLGTGQFGVKAVVSRVLNGVRETKSMEAFVALVEFDYDSISVEGAQYNETEKLEVFTAYENLSKSFALDYTFKPENYTSGDTEQIEELKIKREILETYGYYPVYDPTITDDRNFYEYVKSEEAVQNSSYHVNYTYDAETKTWTPIDLMDQLYIVASNGAEQKISWSTLSAEDNTYTYTYFEGTVARFKLTYDKDTHRFEIVGSSTTSSVIKMRAKNVIYLQSAGTDIYWESSFDFGIEVKSYTDEDSPEAINNVEEFLAIKDEGNAKNYILMNDIVLKDYVPFATDKIISLDGNGYTIYINSFDQSAQTGTLNLSLFTTVSSNTILKNIRTNWYEGGQIEVETSSEGFTNIKVAGIAITNNGIIYNSEVVAFYDERYHKEEVETPGLMVSYFRGTIPYYIDGNSAVQSVVSGMVIENSGSITNSRVGGESTRVINGSHYDKVYYSDVVLDVFTISAQGEINGFVSNNTGTISASKVSNSQITNNAEYNQFETAGFVNTNSGKIVASYIMGVSTPNSYSCIGSNISSKGIVAGFVVNNATSGEISDSMSNIAIVTTSLFGSGFVYINDGSIKYCFSGSQVDSSSYTQMGFTGVDKEGNILSTDGNISFSYYFDTDTAQDDDIETSIDSGATIIELSESNNQKAFYGFSFATGNNETDMLSNADGIWYFRDDGKISIISADNLAYSVRYIAGTNKDNSFIYAYCDMVNNEPENENYGISHTTQYGSKYNPIIIATANDFDNAMGRSTSTNISQYFSNEEVFGSYRFVRDINFDELEKQENGSVRLSSTTKVLTRKYRNGVLIGNAGVDGNGFTIKNVSIASSDDSDLGEAQSFGLFARVEKGAIIANLNLEVVNVTADEVYVVGALAGAVNNATIVNINVEQNYTLDENESAETSEDGVIARNIAGGIIGTVNGASTIKNLSIKNSIVQVSYYDSTRSNTDYYLNSLNMREIRATLLNDSKSLYVFKNLSIAGGAIGFIDTFEVKVQDRQFNYEHKSDDARIYRIYNVSATSTVNVRGELAGGLFGYTSATTNSENISIKLSVDEEKSSFVSKILSYNAYAGAITALGSGYYYRAMAGHDDVAQAKIEESYRKYYEGSEEASESTRGLQDIFYSTLSGNVKYDYNPQYIGGLIGVMEAGEVDNSYSKLNVLAENGTKTTAGGIIGRVPGSKSQFSFGIDVDLNVSTTTNVMLKEVYATGDVRGGNYYNESESRRYGYGGGIVGQLDKTATLAMQSVNAVNAFSFEGVAIDETKDPAEGSMDSVGVYAFVGGSETTSGKIKVIAAPEYNNLGETVQASTRSIGYFASIVNPSSDAILEISPWAGANARAEVIKGNTPHIDISTMMFKITPVSEFADVIDGYNSVAPAFLVGTKHWNPTKWIHTSEGIYPRIRYTAVKTFYYLDVTNREEIMGRIKEDSDLTIYVRGLDADGLYKNVDLTGYSVNNFSGSFIGPEGWLSEEAKQQKIISVGKNGEYIGISVKDTLFTSVDEGFKAEKLNIYYGYHENDEDLKENDTDVTRYMMWEKIYINGDLSEVTKTFISATNSAFIGGVNDENGTGITLSDLNFVIMKNTYIEISIESAMGATEANAGFVVPQIKKGTIEDVVVSIDNQNSAKTVFTFTNNSGATEVNIGLIAGSLEMDPVRLVEDNILKMSSDADITLMNVINPKGTDTKNVTLNVGIIYGKVTEVDHSGEPSCELVTKGLDIKGSVTVDINANAYTNVVFGGQIGYVDTLKKLTVSGRASEGALKVNIESSLESLTFGGIVGEINALGELILAGGAEDIANCHLLLSDAEGGAKVKTLNAGGMIGNIGASGDSYTINEGGSVLNIRLDILSRQTTIEKGQIGGIIGATSSALIINKINATFNAAGSADTDHKEFSGSFNYSGNLGGVMGQNSQELTLNEITTSGIIRSNGSTEIDGSAGYISGGVGLVLAPLNIGSTSTTGLVSTMDLYSSNAVIGGVVSDIGSVGGGAFNVNIYKSLFSGTIQLFNKIDGADPEAKDFVVGGIVGHSHANAIVNITGSGFGGNFILTGDTSHKIEGTIEDYLLASKKDTTSYNINVEAGGIAGKTEGTTTITTCYSFGDMIVRYGGDFTRLNSLTCGGIVGIGGTTATTTIEACVSLFTLNNDREATTQNAGVFGGGNATLSGTNTNKNKYSSAVTIRIEGSENAEDIGYYLAYSSNRTGYKNSENYTDTGIGLITKAMTDNGWSKYIDTPEGSKLNPYVLTTDQTEKFIAKTPVVYIVATSDTNLNDYNNIMGFNSDNNLSDGRVQKANDYDYNYSIAFIGDGHSISYGRAPDANTKNVAGITYAGSYSLFSTLRQNDIISSVVANVDNYYDYNGEEKLNIGGLVATMEGGNIYSSAVQGRLSVGGSEQFNLSGFIGEMHGGIVSGCYTSVDVTYRGKIETLSSSAANVAGFASVNVKSDSRNGIIRNSYSTGKVESYVSAYVYGFSTVYGSTSSDDCSKYKIYNNYSISPVILKNQVGKVESYFKKPHAIRTYFGIGYINGQLFENRESVYGENFVDETLYNSDIYSDATTDEYHTSVEPEKRSDMVMDYAGTRAGATEEDHWNSNAWVFASDKNYGYPMRNFGYLQRSTKVTINSSNYKDYGISDSPASSFDAHLVPNAHKLKQMKNNGNYILEYDIDFADTASYAARSGSSFLIYTDGTNELTAIVKLYGNGHTIDNMKYVGLFSSLDSSAVIDNLRITNATLTDLTGGKIGVLARQSHGATIKNITVSGSITGDGDGEGNGDCESIAVGGLVGKITSGSGTITNVKNYVAISWTGYYVYIGGIAGKVNSGATLNLTNCINYAPLKANGGNNLIIGGILGGGRDGSLKATQCGNANSILCGYEDYKTDEDGKVISTANTYYAGGIAGEWGGGFINKCYNSAMIKAGHKGNKSSGASYAGGIAGKATDTNISTCLNQGFIEALGANTDAEGNAPTTETIFANGSTEYSINGEQKTPDNNALLLKYNSGGIVNVYASPFYGYGDSTTDASCYNSGKVYKNGLFGEQILETFDGNEVEFLGNKTFEESSRCLDCASYQIGKSSDADIYIQSTDDLGGPKAFYITVPRTIFYSDPNTFTTRKENRQLIYTDGSVDETYEAMAKKVPANPSSLTSVFTTSEVGVTLLSWMDTTVTSQPNDLTITTIGGAQFAVAEDEKSAQQALKANVVTIEDIYGDVSSETIDGKTVKALIGAGYNFEIEVVEVPAGLSGEVATVQPNKTNNTLEVKIYATNTTGASIMTNNDFSYKITATKPGGSASATLAPSSLYWKDEGDGIIKAVILDNIDRFDEMNTQDVIEYLNDNGNNGKTYEVTFTKEGTEKVTKTMTYHSAETEYDVSYFEFKDATGGDTSGEYCLSDFLDAYEDATISFNLYQNATLTTTKAVLYNPTSTEPAAEINIGDKVITKTADTTIVKEGTATFENTIETYFRNAGYYDYEYTIDEEEFESYFGAASTFGDAIATKTVDVKKSDDGTKIGTVQLTYAYEEERKVYKYLSSGNFSSSEEFTMTIEGVQHNKAINAIFQDLGVGANKQNYGDLTVDYKIKKIKNLIRQEQTPGSWRVRIDYEIMLQDTTNKSLDTSGVLESWDKEAGLVASTRDSKTGDIYHIAYQPTSATLTTVSETTYTIEVGYSVTDILVQANNDDITSTESINGVTIEKIYKFYDNSDTNEKGNYVYNNVEGNKKVNYTKSYYLSEYTAKYTATNFGSEMLLDITHNYDVGITPENKDMTNGPCTRDLIYNNGTAYDTIKVYKEDGKYAFITNGYNHKGIFNTEINAKDNLTYTPSIRTNLVDASTDYFAESTSTTGKIRLADGIEYTWEYVVSSTSAIVDGKEVEDGGEITINDIKYKCTLGTEDVVDADGNTITYYLIGMSVIDGLSISVVRSEKLAGTSGTWNDQTWNYDAATGAFTTSNGSYLEDPNTNVRYYFDSYDGSDVTLKALKPLNDNTDIHRREYECIDMRNINNTLHFVKTFDDGYINRSSFGFEIEIENLVSSIYGKEKTITSPELTNNKAEVNLAHHGFIDAETLKVTLDGREATYNSNQGADYDFTYDSSNGRLVINNVKKEGYNCKWEYNKYTQTIYYNNTISSPGGVTGVIFKADVDFGMETISSLHNISGNGHFINGYSINTALAVSAGGYVKDLSVGATVALNNTGSTVSTTIGMLSNGVSAGASISRVRTYGALANVGEGKYAKLSGFAGSTTSGATATFKDISSYVNFSSYKDDYKWTNDNDNDNFVGIIWQGETSIFSGTIGYHGVHVGYDGADGRDGKGENGCAGQSVYKYSDGAVAGANDDNAVIFGGKGGKGGVGKNGDGGGDKLSDSTVWENRLGESGGAGGYDGNDGNTGNINNAEKSTAQACSGVNGWNGVNLYRYSFKFETYYTANINRFLYIGNGKDGIYEWEDRTKGGTPNVKNAGSRNIQNDKITYICNDGTKKTFTSNINMTFYTYDNDSTDFPRTGSSVAYEPVKDGENHIGQKYDLNFDLDLLKWSEVGGGTDTFIEKDIPLAPICNDENGIYFKSNFSGYKYMITKTDRWFYDDDYTPSLTLLDEKQSNFFYVTDAVTGAGGIKWVPNVDNNELFKNSADVIKTYLRAL